ncbi:MAG: zf-HC2 domain-containing protein [Oscillospiraceae bacterium]|nr:zf-HC2 domain-containing protein [Oscillospiraceae bacterium]
MMYPCKDFEQLISALIDNVITDDEKIALTEHLEQCPACAAYLSDQLAISQAMRALECPTHDSLTSSIMERVHQTCQDRPVKVKKVLPFPTVRRWIGVAACCAVVALGVFAVNGMPFSMKDSAVSGGAVPESRYDTGVVSTAPKVPAAAPAAPEEAVPENNFAPQTAMAEHEESTATPKTTPTGASGADNSACVADTVENYQTYARYAEYTARLTTDSSVATQWVLDTLGDVWSADTYYLLTQAQYEDLKTLLIENNEPFDEILGTQENNCYQLLAQ